MSVDGGGGSSSSGGYTLLGTADQPDAGVMQGSGFSLSGGLLGGVAIAPPTQLPGYLPLVVR